MRLIAKILFVVLSSVGSAQTIDTLTIKYSESKYDTTLYRRIVIPDPKAKSFHVTDTYLSGQIALKGDYRSIDPTVKEEFWNYHHTHIKHGYFRKWYDNGQLEWEGRFDNGLIQGKVTSWYRNGQPNFTGAYSHGMQHGSFTYYDENGRLRYRADFENGSTIRPRITRYDYLTYLPKDYDVNGSTQWPAIIFLHGGSSRGSDLKRVKANGIPDRIERGKELPFVVIAPQCPVDRRWETDDWFDIFYGEITSRYRIDTNRIYLTGFSLGGSGTWYLAMKHPSTFAAIAPISGKTSHLQFIMDNACTLAGMPIWMFHGTGDEIVDINETYQIAKKLDQCNVRYSLSTFEGYKHWQTQWEVYGEEKIYSWFLECRRHETK
ncbi:MAG TPA: prolyl oligopeptidase family serine peptidase [Bacteroidota bacterium]|nr:prolyl oligopeptidase family serine peptidase [Bacteroidota bacterium]